MDALINTFDFNHDDKQKANDCNTAIRDWWNKNQETCNGQDVIDAIHSLGDKLTQGQCPSYLSEGWKQATSVFTTVTSFAKNQVVEGKLSPDLFHQALVKMVVQLFYYGPTTVHVQIILIAMPYIKDYTQSLQSDKVKEILEAVCSPITIKEDTEDKKIYELYKRGVTEVIREAFLESQLQEKEILKVVFTFIFHAYIDYSHLDKDCYDHVVSAGYQIYNYMKKSWKSYEDEAGVRQFIKKIDTFVKQPGFPQSKAVEGNVGKLFVFIRDITEKPGQAEMFSTEVFDLLESLSRCQTDETELLFDMFSTVCGFFWRQKKDNLKNNTSLFNVVLPRFKTLLEIIDIQFLRHTRFATELVDVLEKTFGNNKQLVPQWISLIVPLLRRPTPSTLRACNDVLRKDDAIKWKEHLDVATSVFEALINVEIPIQKDKQSEEFCDQLTSCASYFLRGVKKARALKSYGEGLMLYSIKLLEMNNPKLFDLAEDAAENIEINVKANKESVMQVMKRLFDLLKNEDLPWLSNRRLQRAVDDLLESTLHPVSDGKIFSDEDLKLLIEMCSFCLSQEAINPHDSFMSPYYLVAVKIMNKLFSWLGTTKRLGLTSKLIPLFIRTYDEDDETLFQLNSRYLTEIAQLDPAILAPFLGQMIKIFLDKEDPFILGSINIAYPKFPHPLKEHFQEMLSYLLDNSNPTMMMWLCQIFHEASKKQPELFTEENMKSLVDLAINDRTHQATILQMLQELSRRKPEKMVKNMDSIITSTEWNPLFTSILNNIVCSLALNNKAVANKAINYLLESMRTNQEKANSLTALNSVRLIGFKYPDVLKPRRPDIEKINALDGDDQSIKQTILDMIDGKTSDELKSQLNDQQNVLNDLVDKVDDVEVIVIAMDEELSNQGEQLQNVTNELNDQGQRLDTVEETVEETVTKVEEIDNKTLSHAPYWARDISKHLNPLDEHDWRLLSSRLGYSNDDIRGWAQQADPCMAMLNEWYATHKTSEATLAVLNHLQEMARMDAAIIVENAMKNAEAVVEDEEFEYASPPPIFISYQWGHQEEVKLLKKHLEMAGYECWMDIGQMGGGDKLFEKIDNGIRAAKVVISCITNKYTKSPNCNREVNLSVGLHKPIIPLLLEQCPWPPPGSMGPIFSESLFIRFYQRSGEETTDDRYWSEPKFQELLMQLNMNGLPPDETKIQPAYRNWWIPIEEKIIIDKSKTRNGGSTRTDQSSSTDIEKVESPEVFISYQWGKQKNIIKLYERLTSMGFSCWLDIKQMGGGDSLYDKIDRGIRGSKVVLSCVTQKYALSANCRREVSLADALKKPLLPLLLEKMTWPPAGPMSMVMTQLLYIGFTEEEQQTSWNGPQFDELISKIHQHIPSKKNIEIQGEPSGQEENKSKDMEEGKDKLHNLEIKEKPHQTTESVQDHVIPTETAENPAKPKAVVKPMPSDKAAPPSSSAPPQASSPEKKKKSKTCCII